jgi:exopolyphosphatase/guanosine-5'-triphosphate,3'-diphosphate pyrophosphatase
MTKETFAAIDIGSNAIRLLVSYVERNGATEFKKAAFIRVPVRLGEDVFTTGDIGPEKGRRLIEAMQGFAHLIRAFDVRAYRACATSAMREAAGGPALVEEIRRASGLTVEIISGQQEAETIFEAGDIAGLMNSDKRYLYVDVGGGSTEVTVYSNRRRAFSESFALGTVRMLSGKVEQDEMERFKDCLKDIRQKYAPVAIIGSGGNINKAHKMLSKKEKDKNDPLHYVELKLLFEQLNEMSYEERMEKFGLNDYRADVIIPALEIFLTACRAGRIDEIIVPRIGLVDGIIHQLYRRSISG